MLLAHILSSLFLSPFCYNKSRKEGEFYVANY
nr:MAG TPA: hypothetical protein [Caudoviricetes sp.]